MKDIKTIVITSILLIYSLSGSVNAEETQSDEGAADEQTVADKESSEQKRKTEEEPECD